jgi:hypothetical protein
MNRSKWHAPARLAAVLALSVAGLGAGCGLSDDAGESKEASADVVDQTTVPADDGSGGSVTTGTTPEDEASGAIDVSGVELPRTVTYAGFEFTLDAVEPYTDDFEGPGVTLSLTVKNLINEIGELAPETIGIKDADGVRVQAVAFDDPDDASAGYAMTQPVEVAPNGKAKRTAFVPVEGELKLADATLLIAEDKKLPAEVPLSGEVPESAFPLPVTVPTGTVQLDGVFTYNLTLKSAELIEEYGRVRASEGTHLVAVQMRIEPLGPNAYFDDNTVRLVVDGTPYGAVHQDPSSLNIITGGADDLVEVYELPDDYEEVSMLGTSDNSGGEHPDQPFAITVPPLPGS